MEEGRNEKGRFDFGNKLWNLDFPGAPRKFETAQDLWDACVAYFNWCAENPLFEDTLVTFQGNAKHEPVAKLRAVTNEGLCAFININRSTWVDWRKNRPDLKDVIDRVDAIIHDHNFSGANAGMLNASLIARQLGLAEKQEHTSPDGSMTPQTITRRVVDPKEDG